MLLFLLLLVACASIGTEAFVEDEKDIGHIGAYPTNFFKDIVPRFVNDRPTVGILSIGLDGEKALKEDQSIKGKSYFGASYAKFIESAGARAIGIREDISPKELRRLLHKINGVVLPGNDVDSGDAGYYRVVKRILTYSRKQFEKKGEKFPILGICRGAQRMMMAATGKDFLYEADLKNISMPLKLTNDVKKSQLFGHIPEGLLKMAAKKPLAFYYQDFFLPKENFYNNTKLKSTFRLLATNRDRNGSEIISTFEGRKFPWYGLMWHPEKAQFVFNPTLAVDHSIYSIILSQYVANFFVSQVKQNPNRFDSREDEQKAMLYKEKIAYVGNITESQYEQVYYFNLKLNPAKLMTDNTKDDEEENDHRVAFER